MTTDRPPVRWGLLGTGGITRKLMAGAAATPTAEIVAVGSRTQARADEFAAGKGIARAHGSYEALLADPEVDAVYISLPNSMHHPWTMAALAAGKHVLCEKPYTRHPEEVAVAWDAAEAAGLVLQEAFMWRHHPQADLMRGLLPELGPLQVIRATFAFVLTAPYDVRIDAELEGGSLMDVGCYTISGSRLLAGRGAGRGRRLPGGRTDRRGPDVHRPAPLPERGRGRDRVGVHDGPPRARGDRHRRARSGRRTRGSRSRPPSGTATTRPPTSGMDPYGLELADMAAAIRGEKAPRLGRADALGQARTIEALYRSAATGAPVRL